MHDFNRGRLACLLSRVGLALCGIFLAPVISVAMPPRLLDPVWQLSVISALINNGSIALVGFVLILIAASLHDDSSWLGSSINASPAWPWGCPRLPAGDSLPGRCSDAWLQGSHLQRERTLRQGNATIEELRCAVHQSRSSSELQSRLQSLRASTPPLNLNRPIEVVRPDLLGFLEMTETKLRLNTRGSPMSGCSP